MKLTNRIKQQIVDNALAKAGIPEREAALRARRAAWVEKVRIDALGGQEAVERLAQIEAEINKLIADIPSALVTKSSFIHTDTDIGVNVAGLTARVWWCGAMDYDSAINKQRRISPYGRVTIAATNPLADEFMAMHNEQQAIASDRERIATNVKGALSNITTDKRLLEVWPEAAELLPADVTPAGKQLPAVRVDELNTLIGLPSPV